MAFLPFLAVAISIPNASFAREITLSAANLPPHMTSDGQGREADILRAIFARCGHQVRFVISPFGRHYHYYESHPEIDALALTQPGVADGYLSAPYIQFQNGVSMLADDPRMPKSIQDLNGMEVVTFKYGSRILGLSAMRDQLAGLTEVADQEIHSKMLLMGRVDAVISDGLILAEYNRQLAAANWRGTESQQAVRFTAIFPPTAYHLAFRDPELTTEFNQCVADTKADGTLNRINRDYIDLYRNVVGDQYLGY